MSPNKLNQRLLEAAGAARLKAMRALLSQGADPEARGADGRSALRVALEGASARAAACAGLLMKAGANPNRASGSGRGLTALEVFLHVDHASMETRENGSRVSDGFLNLDWLGASAAHLIGAGADVHARDERGWTPLMQACWALRSTAAHELLDAGADPLAYDRLGGRQALGMLAQAIDSRGGSARAWPEVQQALGLVERLVELGSDFDASAYALPPAVTFGGSSFLGVRAMAERLALRRLGLRARERGGEPQAKGPRL